MAKKTVVVGMSGGVDSSVAALLLKEQGYNVIGLFMKNWDEKTENGCCTAQIDYEDVKRVCAKIDIPYYTVNFAKEYMENVFQYFLAAYKAGHTPNPDVLCNREIKFKHFKERAVALGADYIATGHYCNIAVKDGKNYLLKSKDRQKDQTYFLNQVTQRQLDNVLFPLGIYEKTQVRAIAQQYHLSTATKKDSTGICFIGERNFRKFLQNYLPAQPGKILNLQGQEVGEHIGLMYYTIGQRRGINLGGRKGDGEGRWFVVKKDINKNILYVSCGDESPLYSTVCSVKNMNWILEKPFAKQFDCTAKFRYRQEEQKVTITVQANDSIIITADEGQRAVTTGQYAVLYMDDICLGGGVITNILE